MIKFFSTVNQLVKDFKTGKTIFAFDKKGELLVENDNEYLNRLKLNFRNEIVLEKPKSEKEKLKI